jgi:hypothetical protein
MGQVTAKHGFARHAARQEAPVRDTEFVVAIPAPVLPQTGQKAAQTLNAGILPDQQQ